MGLCVLLKVFPWSFCSAAGGPSWTIRPAGGRECRPRQDGTAADLAPRASCALLNGEGMGVLVLVYGFLWDAALLVAVNQLPVWRIGRLLRASPRADVMSALLVEGSAFT